MDLKGSIDAKITLNEEKHPVELSRGSSRKHSRRAVKAMAGPKLQERFVQWAQRWIGPSELVTGKSGDVLSDLEIRLASPTGFEPVF